MNLRKMIETMRAYRAGAPLGDVVVLKLDAISGPPKGIAQRLEAVRGYAPEQNLAALRALPPGTLGREYARFLDANGIEPLVISAAVKERFRDNPFALRYTTTHDLHHVLDGLRHRPRGRGGELRVQRRARGRAGNGQAPLVDAHRCTRSCRRARRGGSGTTSGSAASSAGRRSS